MKYHFCSRCNLPSKKIFNCKYEEDEDGWFLLCSKCAILCRNIYKKTFKKLSGKFVSIGMVKSRKERSLI